ncbi:MAG: hypothetical protein M5R36_19175 [Deltaproteobacteria bacterium]|nr:hypothetical protein [Deltaproteobacteria bacterium]
MTKRMASKTSTSWSFRAGNARTSINVTREPTDTGNTTKAISVKSIHG